MAEEQRQHRKDSLAQAATGGVLYGTGRGTVLGLDARRRKYGAPHPLKAAYRSARGRPQGWKSSIHVPDLAGRTAARSLQAVGLPLAAYGAVNAVRKKPKKVTPVPRRELASHVARQAVYLPTVQAGANQLGAVDDTFRKDATDDARAYLSALPPGRHRVPAQKIDAAVAGSGFRLYDRHYVARMARDMDSDPKLRSAPTRFAVHEGGGVHQIDGAHRYAARNMRGQSHVPVQIVSRPGQAPRKRAKVYRPARARMQRQIRAHDRGMDRAKLDRMASGVPGWVDPVNRRLSNLAGKNDVSKALRVVRRMPRQELVRGLYGRKQLRTVPGTGGPYRVSQEQVRDAARQAGFTTSAGTPRRLTHADVAEAVEVHNYGGVGTALGGGGAYHQALRLRPQVSKALTSLEQRKLDTHRRVGRTASLVGGTLGVSALALRAPAGAKALVRRGVGGRRLTRLANAESSATRHSNTTGVLAIGTGSLGSFNYAAQQKLERKQTPVIKAELDLAARSGAKTLARLATRVPPGVDPKMYALVRRSRRADAQRAFQALPGYRSAVGKRDDRFLRGYRERISPDAERGYKHLRSGRNRQTGQAATAATMGGLSGWLLSHESRARPMSKPGVAVTAASTLGALATAGQNAMGAARYNAKMDKIKAKARSRRAQGLYGPGRGLSPVDTTSARAHNLAKAMGALT